MRYTGLAYRLPRPIRRHILHFEVEISDAVEAFASVIFSRSLTPGSLASERHFVLAYSNARSVVSLRQTAPVH